MAGATGLESPGGRVGQARAIAGMIRAAGLDAEVTTSCVSACTIMFFSGRHRWLREGARLGFHSYSSAAMTPQAIVLDEEIDRRAYTEAGVSPAFIERIFSVPPAQVWYPAREEVAVAGFATSEVPARAIPEEHNLVADRDRAEVQALGRDGTATAR